MLLNEENIVGRLGLGGTINYYQESIIIAIKLNQSWKVGITLYSSKSNERVNQWNKTESKWVTSKGKAELLNKKMWIKD